MFAFQRRRYRGTHGEVDDASSAAFGIVNPQVLFGVYLEARVVLIPQRRAIHRVGRQPSDGRDAFTFQVRRDGELLDGRSIFFLHRLEVLDWLMK